jgi:hypothetical protein
MQFRMVTHTNLTKQNAPAGSPIRLLLRNAAKCIGFFTPAERSGEEMRQLAERVVGQW